MNNNTSLKDEIIRFIDDEFDVKPEYPWQKTPDSAVFRHYSNKKWFAAILNVSAKHLGLEGDEIKEIIDLKSDEMLIEDLKKQNGYFPAYHMNKRHWITVLLDGSVPIDEIINLIKLSYVMTDNKK